MGAIWTIARKEWATYFYSPVAYVVLFIFLLGSGYNFYEIVSMVNQQSVSSEHSVLSIYIGLNFWFWLFMVLIPAILTMRLFAEEKRSGTFEGLMTAPVTNLQVVLGKYIAAFGFFLLLWLPTLFFVYCISYFSIPQSYEGARFWAALTFNYDGAPDLGPIVLGYLLTFLIGASYIAIGLLASACTRNQVSAALVAMVAAIVLFLVPLLSGQHVKLEWGKELLKYTNMVEHYLNANRGIFDTRPVAFHLSLTGFCLFATVKVVELR